MGVRGHVRVSQPRYGEHTLSAWVDGHAKRWLYGHGIDVNEGECRDCWEIEVTDRLRDLAKRLADGGLRADFDGRLPEGMRGEGYDADLGRMLQEGIGAADGNGESYITIEWF